MMSPGWSESSANHLDWLRAHRSRTSCLNQELRAPGQTARDISLPKAQNCRGFITSTC
jgi:hypothetical protein